MFSESLIFDSAMAVTRLSAATASGTPGSGGGNPGSAVLSWLVIASTFFGNWSFGVGSAKAQGDPELKAQFTTVVQPFLENYCLRCHDSDKAEGDLDLSRYESLESVVADDPHWASVLERLEVGDMPPAKARKKPSPELRREVVGWVRTLRDQEARRNAGDPGPVLARRLSNAEYDYTIHDLTGADIRPTRTFPVDPANQAGFDNSGESLTISPALLKKYLQAAREVSEHLALTPDGFTFAPHPVVADTDRDKWAVFRIVNFYRRQPTDYADYFEAAWRYKHRAALGTPDASLEDVATASRVSAKYLALIWSTLSEASGEVGPIARLQATWRELPAPTAGQQSVARQSCEAMRDYVVHLRGQIVPEVKNLTARPIQDGSQTLVLWKNRQMAANRRKFNPAALRVDAASQPVPVATEKEDRKSTAASPPNNAVASLPTRPKHVQAPTVEAVKRGGISLAPTLVTRESSATSNMAQAKKHGIEPELVVPADPAARARYEAAFAKFADTFPDAFYITERARVYLDAEKEQENAGRLLSAGLHSMTGYFRDDGPLMDLILDDAGQRELDGLWQEFDFLAAIPQRMHTSFLWFERTDSAYLRDPEFDPYRPEDKSVTSQEKIRALGELYLAKARRINASETVQHAITQHFENVASNILRVEQQRAAAEPRHLEALEDFTQRAYRRPLSTDDRHDLREFYRISRSENGLDHEEAMRDCIARVLMSPHFSFRFDLLEASGNGGGPFATGAPAGADTARPPARPLSDYSLASRLSYFLWASMPDEELLAHAGKGDLHKPEIIRAQAARMLKDGRVRNFATEFAGNWLDFRRFEQHNSVDRERFPAFNDDLRRAMFEEPIRFFVDVAQANRSVLDFLYATDTFVNGPLARHYGIPLANAASHTWTRVERADEFGRGGLLPMAAFLTANSPGLRTSPVKRGNWLVKRILGERIPPPPPNVPELPSDEAKPGELSLREALAKHREVESCAACHARFDSFGLVFENYGPTGELRERDLGGRPVDTRAEFPNRTEGSGLPGLQSYVREHRQADFVRNLCRKLLAYGLGRTLILSDEPLIDSMQSELAAQGYRFSSLIETIVTSPQFTSKRSFDTVAHH
ncbi:MAG TPA: DUF1592 domain-containing protein [Chthoniobacteraceae bacterium]|nr:DUF1592 domain-containing protein [Chthoniobacteraceae bacterium]